MRFFNKLPVKYQSGINQAITEFWGEENSFVSDAYRDAQAESLLECDIHNSDEITQKDIDEWMNKLCWFSEGWKAREHCKTQPSLL